MGYLLLLLATLSWSFVGILVQTASEMVDSSTITFLRFALGVVFLGGFLWIKRRTWTFRFDIRWLWIGAAGKGVNYFFENIGLSIGYSYGNILVLPVQTVLLLLCSVLWFKERLSARGWWAAFFCLAGVWLISWNGRPLGELASGGGLYILGLFVVAGVGAALHVISQKQLSTRMEPGEMNVSMFLISSLLMAAPLPFQAEMTGELAFAPIAALLALGLITGLSFYWFSQALKLVSFPMAVLVSNTSVLFGLLWAGWIKHDPITPYLIAGAALFAAGMVLLNWPSRRMRRIKEAQRGVRRTDIEMK